MTGDRFNVGVVTPHAAAGPEAELLTMTRGRVTTVVSRTRLPPPALPPAPRPAPPAHAELLTSTEDAALDRAAETFAGTSVVAVAHASTTTCYVIGPLQEAALVARLSHRFQVPAVASCTATVGALRAHGVDHVQLVHPPWFDDEFDHLGAAYFRTQGFDAVVTRASGLPSDPADVQPDSVVDWVEHHLDDRCDAVFLAGNGFRAAQAVEEIERRTGRIVLAANQALLWGILEATGADYDLPGYGRLLRASP